MKVYFSDFFDISPEVLENYGAMNISLINDMPLFIDPFLLFGSDKAEYKKMHNEILKYIGFLKEKSANCQIGRDSITAWYKFSEVKQNWLGYSKIGNSGSGLGEQFGLAFSNNINTVFKDLGQETVTLSSHIEKAALFENGVGRDNISDFTVNLIKPYILEYTQDFARNNLSPTCCKLVNVDKVYFDYKLERWMPKQYYLPFIFNDYVLLTPKDILTVDRTWINRDDMLNMYDQISTAVENEQLRVEINNYFNKVLPRNPNGKITQKERKEAAGKTYNSFTQLVDLYLKTKEENKELASKDSIQKVSATERLFIDKLSKFSKTLEAETDFYLYKPSKSYDETLKRLGFMKHVIENNDGYKLFYVDGEPIKREADLQVIYRLTWFASDYDVNREVNNGRGPVDYSISKGSNDKSLVEFKLASNSKLRMNLAKQVEVYEKANNTESSFKVILYFDENEHKKILKVLNELGLTGRENIILIDAGRKESASNVRI